MSAIITEKKLRVNGQEQSATRRPMPEIEKIFLQTHVREREESMQLMQTADIR